MSISRADISSEWGVVESISAGSNRLGRNGSVRRRRCIPVLGSSVHVGGSPPWQGLWFLDCLVAAKVGGMGCFPWFPRVGCVRMATPAPDGFESQCMASGRLGQAWLVGSVVIANP